MDLTVAMGELPSGTVTLFFSDVEGSTRHLLRLADAYPAMMREHRQLLEGAIQGAAGTLVDHRGDGCFAVFGRAIDAVRAALGAQRALAAHQWPDSEPVRVRLGLHTGEPLRSAEGYHGLDVVRATRICDAGHGGQILLSRTTRDLVEDALPSGVTVRDLGEHRLKDVPHLEHMFQLVADDLPSHFPNVRSVEAPTNLPHLRRPIIGRERELATIRGLLLQSHASLLTLTGTGGTGKTRLALEVASQAMPEFSDGVYLVALAALADPARLPSAIAAALGVTEAPGRPVADRLVDAIGDRRMLLLLDNFEQILGGGSFVAALLEACPRLCVLVTSREALRLSLEREVPVPPLPLPRPGAAVSSDEVDASPAVQLFVERARETVSAFALHDGAATAVAEICQRLDGLPLAIELAAARVRLLPPAALLARLDRRLPLLTGGPRDAPARQRTLRDAIGWSYDLLAEADQGLFRRLAIFSGGFSLDAAEHVVQRSAFNVQPDLPSALNVERRTLNDVLDGLSSLVDKSLLVQEPSSEEPRFAMLETVREFAAEQLEAIGEWAIVRQRHAGYFLDLVEALEPGLEAAEESRWLRRFEVDLDNIRAAFGWAIERCDAEVGLRLGAAGWRFWQTKAYLREGRDWLDRVLALPEPQPREPRARAVFGRGRIALIEGDLDAAEGCFQESLRLSREVGDLGHLAGSLTQLGHVAYERGDLATAWPHYQESLAIRRARDHHWGLAISLGGLGHLLVERGELDAAEVKFQEALASGRRVGFQYGIAAALHGLARVALERGEHDLARSRNRESLAIWRGFGDTRGILNSLDTLAAVDLAAGKFERSTQLLGAVEAGRTSLGIRRPPIVAADHDEQLIRAREALGRTRFAEAWAAGQAMSIEEASAYALDAAPPV